MADDRRRPSTWDEAFPGRFIRAETLQGRPRTLTITDLYLEELPEDDKDKAPEDHLIAAFKETKRELRLCKTNGLALAAMFGTDPPKWIGHRVTFFPTKAMFGREQVDAIRVYGSPELEHDTSFDLKLPRRKPQKVQLKAVRKQQKTAEQRPEPTLEPEQQPPEKVSDGYRDDIE